MDKIYAILVAAALTSHAGTLKPAKRHDVPALFMYMYKVKIAFEFHFVTMRTHKALV